MEGIDLFGRHIEVRDEDNTIVRLTVQDAPIEWSDDVLVEIFSEYGSVVRMDKEYIYYEGRRTAWTTGTRFIYMTDIESVSIPYHLPVIHKKQQVTLTVHYKNRATLNSVAICSKCGSLDHAFKDCTKHKKVCYLCKKDDHLVSKCPLNDGTRKSEEAVVKDHSAATST